MVFPWYEMSFADLWRSRTGVFFRDEVAQMAEQLFDGIKCLHRARMWHGDLSFSNLLISGSAPCGSQPASKFGLVIADFGSASYVPATRRPKCSEQCQAPELVLQVPTGQLTEAIDVWAAGIFVASACTGRMFPKCPECVGVLGPLTEAEWPGCSTMTVLKELNFEEFADSCPLDFDASDSLRDWFQTDLALDPAVEMTQSMLTWTASRRKPIDELIGHPFFRRGRAEEELRKSLRRLHRDELEEVVMKCHRGGVTWRGLLTAAPSQLTAAPSQHQQLQPAKVEPPAEPRSSDRNESGTLGPCAGNCGRVSCKFRQNHGTKPICPDCQSIDHPIDHPSRRCDQCRCETIACKGNNGTHGARTKQGDSRWCSSCRRTAQGINKSQYANAHGIHTYKPRWGPQLRLTARLGFVCVRMTPMDVEAVMGFLAFRWVWPWPGFAMATLIVAAALKWPDAIDAFEAALRSLSAEIHNDNGSEPVTAEQALAVCILTAAEAVDGAVMEEMHNELSKTGRAGCLTGMIWLLRRLRFVAPGEEEDDGDGSPPAAGCGSQPAGLKRKSSAKSPKAKPGTLKRRRSGDEMAEDVDQDTESPGMRKELRLGKLQNVYVVECGKGATQSCRRVGR